MPYRYRYYPNLINHARRPLEFHQRGLDKMEAKPFTAEEYAEWLINIYGQVIFTGPILPDAIRKRHVTTWSEEDGERVPEFTTEGVYDFF